MENQVSVVGQTAISIEEIKTIIGSAPQVLSDNNLSITNAKKKGEELISQIERDGMNEALDTDLSLYLGKIKTTIKTMEEKRKPFTQMVTKVVKEFTALEKAMEPITEIIQGHRNTFAAKKLAEENERKRQVLINQNKDAERIEAKKQIELKISELFTKYLAEKKTAIQEMFDGYTLETIRNADIEISGITEDCKEAYDKFSNQITFDPKHISETEVATILFNSITENFATYQETFKQSVSQEKRRLLDTIPSKQTQLKEAADLAEIARLKKIEEDKKAEELRLSQEAAAKLEGEEKAKKDEEARLLAESLKKIQDEQEAARLETERLANEEKERKEKESKRIADESKTINESVTAEIKVNAVAEAATATVQNQGTITFGTPAKKTKSSQVIAINDISAYMILAQFWFEKEGKNMTSEKLELVTFDRIKRFCEKYATDNEEFITSPLITYSEKVTAK